MVSSKIWQKIQSTKHEMDSATMLTSSNNNPTNSGNSFLHSQISSFSSGNNSISFNGNTNNNGYNCWPFSGNSAGGFGNSAGTVPLQIPFFPPMNSNPFQQTDNKPAVGISENAIHSVPTSGSLQSQSSQSANPQVSTSNSEISVSLPLNVPNVNCKITGMITVTNEIKCPGQVQPQMPVPPPNPDYYYTACALGAAGLSTMAVLTGGGIEQIL